jgi:hypothetical protein
MEEIITKISLFKFLLIGLICIGLYFLLDFAFKLIINWNLRNNTGHRLLKLESFIRRIAIIILGVILIGGFIRLNPGLHGIIFIIVILLSYDLLKNIMLGTILHHEIDLRVGRAFRVSEYSGILINKGWTGIMLSSSGQKIFIPYAKAFKEGLSVEQKSLTFKVTLLGKYRSDDETRLTENKMKALLFPLPYLIEGQVPEVDIKENNIYIEVGLVNESYLPSLRSFLSSQGIDTQIIENRA